MEIEITKKAFEKLGGFDEKTRDVLTAYGVRKWDFNYHEARTIDLAKVRTPKRIKALIDILKAGAPHTAKALKDTEAWHEAILGKYAAAKDLKKFTGLLTEFLRNVPGHRVYQRDEDTGLMRAFYVNEIEYNKAERYQAANCEMTLLSQELGEPQRCAVRWYEINNRTPAVALADKGYFPETAELRAEYDKTFKKYLGIYSKIGMQFLATGGADDDLDGNPDEDSKNRWWRRQVRELKLGRHGKPARVVIDVKSETNKTEKAEKADFGQFWVERDDDNDAESGHDDSDDEESVGHWSDDEDSDEPADVDLSDTFIPTWPIVPVFDFNTHLRVRVHIDQLKEYVYDPSIIDRLILPEHTKTVVSMLLAHQGGFKDIVEGKGSGAVVLCVGPPGVGKTLTAEVYAETAKRPLYSVQCSQLGLTPSELEDSLLKVFARAARWNAILMLDEADVYVMERGDSIEQNAIVGVFLRVLEYYQGVLFLTSNRADSIDDAVASRCLARLTYDLPTIEDQFKIWKTLAATMGLVAPDEGIRAVVAAVGTSVEGVTHSAAKGILSGRDVRNLLQLGSLFASATGQPISVDAIKFARKFQPTLNAERDKEK